MNCERVKEDEEKGGQQKEEKVGKKGYEDRGIEAVGARIYLGNRRQSVCFLGGWAEPSWSLSQTQETDEQGKGGLRGVHSLHSMCKDIKGLPWRGSAQAAVWSAIPASSTAVHPGVYLYYSLHMEGMWWFYLEGEKTFFESLK